LSLKNHTKAKEDNIIYDVYIEKECLIKAVKHCIESLPNEAIGFLVGTPYIWKGKIYSYVNGAIAGRAKSTSVHVEFDDNALGDVVKEFKKLYNSSKYMLIGWYHSHPSYGCFMSSTDINSHKNSFREEYHIALVIDPVKKKASLFKLDSNDNPIKVSYAIVDTKRSKK